MKDENLQAAEQPANKQPTERVHKCKNHMLECIHSMENLGVNGSKDSKYSDLIMFEDMFENWDSKAILLTEWHWYRSGDEPYVYFTPIGVYTEIGLFARKLQRLLPHDKKISVIMMGDDLHISVYEADGIAIENVVSYEARLLHLNQINDGFAYDGWKFELIKLPTTPQKD